MYGKIFSTIYDGSLHGNFEALVTFQQLIVLADKNGIVDMTPRAISARTSIPLDIIEAGLKHLSEPDPESRNPKEGGRRIVLLETHRTWGWQIVNHKHYNELINKEDKNAKDRERIANNRKKISDVAECSEPSQSVANVASVSVSVSVSETVSELRKHKSEKDPQPAVAVTVSHGEFKNVILTEDQIHKLAEKFPTDWQERIESLSQYIAQKGNRYKNHYATILAWDRLTQNRRDTAVLVATTVRPPPPTELEKRLQRLRPMQLTGESE